jgi:hypothetical protein
VSWNVSRAHDHPWFNTGHREGAPTVLDSILGLVKTTGPGHPVFTVTAKDIVFAFYSLGFISRRELQHSLENIAQEEQRSMFFCGPLRGRVWGQPKAGGKAVSSEPGCRRYPSPPGALAGVAATVWREQPHAGLFLW